MNGQTTTTRDIETDKKHEAANLDQRAADEQFVAWVLGYGYAAGHFSRPAGAPAPRRLPLPNRVERVAAGSSLDRRSA